MNNLPAKRQLPAIADLYADKELAIKQNDLNKLLNEPPKKDWIKANDMAQGALYLPIARVEFLLTAIYIKWRVEVKSVQVIANSVVTTIRLWVLDPLSEDGQWDWQEGIGASPIQTKKGASATDFAQVNNFGVMMAAPASESFAIKDAAEKFGKLFGKDLNRKDEINYQNMQDKKFTDEEVKPISDAMKMDIDFADTKEALAAIYNMSPEYHENKEFMQLLTKRKAELTKPKADGSDNNGK